ncbi:ABC transporter ATP-binding protein [Candidatus Bathyarchaeota archaeon]|nr:ABC transporter ATP-binding protein [Candidatus Bathyarchaeota archaeon]
MNPPSHIVRLSNVSKKYESRFGLRNVSFTVDEHEIFGLAGPNGAGKSTLIKILATLTKPTGGKVTIAGYDVLRQPRLVKGLIGVSLHNSLLYDELTGMENLTYYLRLHGCRDREEAKDLVFHKSSLFGIEDRLEDPVGNLSSGMRKRLDIIRAAIHNPRLLLLDEPLSELDSEGLEYFRRFLRSAREYSTVIFSTHSLEVVEEISSRVCILKMGELAELRYPEK